MKHLHHSFRQAGRWGGVLMGVGLVGLALSLAIAARAQVPTDDADAGGKTERVGALVSIHDMITDITVESVARRINQAIDAGAEVIIFDMDTPGGLVTSSISIADQIRELADITTVAWVNPTAHSGGSLVAVAADEIVMSRSSRIGDSQVIMGGPGGAMAVPKELQAKAYTPVLADFRQSAKLNGYSEVMCEAFVLPDREVWWIENTATDERRFVFREDKLILVDGEDPDEVRRLERKRKKDKESETEDEPSTQVAVLLASDTPGETPGDIDAEIGRAADEAETDGVWQLVETYYDPIAEAELDLTQPVVRDDMLLEMSAPEAYAFGFCAAIISDEAGIIERYELTSLDRYDPTWSEDLAFWMTSMYVRGFLMLIVLLGAYVEFHTPGVGVPGLTALIALAIFVGAPYLSGLANIWELVVILLGVVLILLEMFVIPGFGVAGISGAILLLFGLLGTFVPDEPGRSFPFAIPTLDSTMEWLKQGMMVMTGAMAASLAGMVILSRYLPKTTMFRRIAPANPTPSDVIADDEYLGVARIGDVGVTVGPLRPAGKARFGSTLVDVVTQGDYLEQGQRIEVIEHRGNRIVVRTVT